uniref:GRIP domain-containing protein n=1 Tax=Caenorhabditis japonica TaxID=281687 RepID=A0A8R1IT16_CAEJA
MHAKFFVRLERTLNEEISQIREELDRQSISRQAAEEESDRRNLQLDSKQKIIEDLENQIEELRSPAAKLKADSYRIDDSTLRQLFLNYFNAEPAKRADIAMLLASILEYPPDEMDKFRTAVRNSLTQASSSFFFGSRASPSGGHGGSSITEQFIRSTSPPSNPATASSSAAALDSLLR